MMSRSSAIRSEDTLPVPIEVSSQTRVFNGFRKQLHRPTNEFRQPPFKRDKAKETHVSLRVETDRKVNIAFRAILSPRDGAEDGESADARRPQFSFVSPEGRDELVQRVHRLSYFPKNRRLDSGGSRS
jgi:hypothetical protein